MWIIGMRRKFKVQIRDDSKCKIALWTAHWKRWPVLKVIKENPHITQKALAAALGKSERTIKTRMSTLQEKGLIQRRKWKAQRVLGNIGQIITVKV